MTLQIGYQTKPEGYLGRFCLDKINEKQFLTTLELQKDMAKYYLSNILSEVPGSKERKTALKNCAETISNIIHTSLELSTR